MNSSRFEQKEKRRNLSRNKQNKEHSHERNLESELVKQLKGIIKFRGGPISVAEYMEEVLTNPKAGFYINGDVFGAEGDFMTSPEVSQMFGEMVGVWAMCLWEQIGQPKRVNLVELGPGRGTLMVDLLRGASKFKSFTESLHVHLVECSPALQKLQHQNLKCMVENSTGENVEKGLLAHWQDTCIMACCTGAGSIRKYGAIFESFSP